MIKFKKLNKRKFGLQRPLEFFPRSVLENRWRLFLWFFSIAYTKQRYSHVDDISMDAWKEIFTDYQLIYNGQRPWTNKENLSSIVEEKKAAQKDFADSLLRIPGFSNIKKIDKGLFVLYLMAFDDELNSWRIARDDYFNFSDDDLSEDPPGFTSAWGREIERFTFHDVNEGSLLQVFGVNLKKISSSIPDQLYYAAKFVDNLYRLKKHTSAILESSNKKYIAGPFLPQRPKSGLMKDLEDLVTKHAPATGRILKDRFEPVSDEILDEINDRRGPTGMTSKEIIKIVENLNARFADHVNTAPSGSEMPTAPPKQEGE